MPLTIFRPRHALPSTRAVAVPALLLAAVAGPLAVLSAAPASLAASPPTATQGDRVLVDLASRSQPERASRTRARAEVVLPPTEPTAPPAAAAPPPAPAAPPPPAATRPSDGVLTSGFGPRWGRLHAGLDFATGTGAPVRAAAAGTVASAAPEGGYGLTVRIQHPDGAETVYAHLSAALVAPGQAVTTGQDVAREGNTGRSTGPHLHFEVRYAGAPTDPSAWLKDRGAAV